MTRLSKFMSFLRARDEIDRPRFQEWFLEHCSARLLGNVPALEGLVINQAIDVPETRPRRAYEAAADPRAYDIVLECWLRNAAEFATVSATLNRIGLAERLSRRHEFQVEETVVLNRQGRQSSGLTPGIKYIGRLLFHQDLPDSAAKRSWAIHGELAVDTFRKLTKYVQNFVVDTRSPDAPATRGIPQLYFECIEDYLDTAPGGQERIAHDLRHLIASGTRLYTRENVVQAVA